MSRGLIPIPCLLSLVDASSRLRRFRFVLVLCVRWFRVISLVSPSVLGLFCAVVSFLRLVICVRHTATALLN